MPAWETSGGWMLGVRARGDCGTVELAARGMGVGERGMPADPESCCANARGIPDDGCARAPLDPWDGSGVGTPPEAGVAMGRGLPPGGVIAREGVLRWTGGWPGGRPPGGSAVGPGTERCAGRISHAAHDTSA